MSFFSGIAEVLANYASNLLCLPTHTCKVIHKTNFSGIFSMRGTKLYSPTNKGQNWKIIVRGLCFIGVWVRDKSNQVFFWVQISKMLKTNNIYFQTCFSAQNNIQRILLRFYMEETYKFSEIFWRSCRRTGSALRQLV